jgi:CheY-like chemotaxis protein
MDRMRVLLVDDDPIITLEAGDYLHGEGFDVVCANSANEALSALEEQCSFGALVTDIDLGEGTDGFGVARCLRAVFPDMPVVFISGSERARREADGIVASTFVAKPFRPQQIAHALIEAERASQAWI